MNYKTLAFFLLFTIIAYSQEVTDTLIIAESDSMAIVDSLSFSDSLITRDSLFVTLPYLSDYSAHINRSDFLRLDYRYAGDFFELHPLSFIKDYGFIGQPNEAYMYGSGAINAQYDGLPISDRFLSNIDLNLLQTEDIESIEFIPSVRGFLFSLRNDPVTVNFITRDFIQSESYSRMKYYQGPDGEAMINGAFNAFMSKKFNLSFSFTNRIKDSTYANTDFSIWQLKVRGKYYFSSDYVLSADYLLADKSVGINGGVDVDSINSMGLNINSVLYDPTTAPVIYSSRNRDDLLRFTALKFLATPIENIKTDLAVYYHLSEININDEVSENLESKSFGVNLKQDINFNPFNLKVLGQYEHREEIGVFLGPEPIHINNNTNVFSLASIVSASLPGNIIPSVFFKTQRISSANSYSSETISRPSGYGFDITYKPINSLRFYGGFSQFDYWTTSDFEVTSIELGASYNSEIIHTDFKYFIRENEVYIDRNWSFFGLREYFSVDLSGFGLLFNLEYWHLLLETQTSAYFSDGQLLNLPDYKFIGGIYYKGMLFDSNLDLKTGFKFTYTGPIEKSIAISGNGFVDASNKLDFILSGEIRKVAIVYFTFENILGSEYYITPFYPMPDRNIRFGIAWEFLN